MKEGGKPSQAGEGERRRGALRGSAPLRCAPGSLHSARPPAGEVARGEI